ncbi:MAG: hypothetical protein ACMG6S_02015 [Byssovorax sp.]
MANLRDSSRGDDNDVVLPPHPEERTPPSASIVSPLSLARELADRLEHQQNGQGDAWRLACALSLSIVDLLESVRASDASGDKAGTDDKSSAAALGPFTR